MSIMTNDSDGFKFQLVGSKTSIAELINWRCLHLSDGAIKAIKCDNLMRRVWAVTGAKENVRCWLCYCCHPITVPVMITQPCDLSGEWCPRMENWSFDKRARDTHLHITTTVLCTPFSCWDAGLAVQQRVVGIRQLIMLRGYCREDFESPRRQLHRALAETRLGGRSHRWFPAALLPHSRPTQKTEMTDTSNSSGESNNNFQLQTGHT